MRARNAVDFDDLLLLSVALLERDADARAKCPPQLTSNLAVHLPYIYISPYLPGTSARGRTCSSTSSRCPLIIDPNPTPGQDTNPILAAALAPAVAVPLPLPLPLPLARTPTRCSTRCCTCSARATATSSSWATPTKVRLS